MRRASKILLGGIAASAALLAPATAGAATVKIGSPLTSSFTQNPAGSTGTSAMVSGPNIASPVDGTVINWHTEGFSGTFRVRAIQFAANVGTATASGPPVTFSGGSNDQSLSLPIKTGEVIGFDNSSGADMAKVFSPSPTYTSAAWGPGALPDNSPQSAVTTFPLEFAMNATVRYCVVPSLRGKKLGAAKKALAAADCTVGKVKKKGKGKKSKFVRSQGVAPGTSVSDTAPIDLKVGKKPKK